MTVSDVWRRFGADLSRKVPFQARPLPGLAFRNFGAALGARLESRRSVGRSFLPLGCLDSAARACSLAPHSPGLACPLGLALRTPALQLWRFACAWPFGMGKSLRFDLRKAARQSDSARRCSIARAGLESRGVRPQRRLFEPTAFWRVFARGSALLLEARRRRSLIKRKAWPGRQSNRDAKQR